MDPEEAGCLVPTTEGPEPTTAAPVPPPVSAFYAVRTTSWTGGDADVVFDDVRVNLDDIFKDNSIFQPGKGGMYFLSYSAGIPAHTEVDTQITQSTIPNSIYRETTHHNDSDLAYRSFMMMMEETGSMTYRSAFDLTANETSFSGFSLTDAMQDLQAFFVSREESYNILSRIEMQSFRIDIGDNYNVSGREFVAPRDGIYYFFFGSGQDAFTDNRVALRTWEGDYPETEAELWVHSTSHNGLHMVTRGTMLELHGGQTIWATLMENVTYSDADHSQIFFGGFLYDPAHAPPVAFSVHKDRPLQSGLPQDPIPFDIIGVNQGNAFDADSNSVVIPVQGYYYIELAVGVLPARGCDVKMLLNGEPGGEQGDLVSHILVASGTHSHVTSAGRSFVAHFNQNDTLRLRLAPNTGVHSDLDKQTNWMGFLLYAD
jgi:hypothetical protein